MTTNNKDKNKTNDESMANEIKNVKEECEVSAVSLPTAGYQALDGTLLCCVPINGWSGPTNLTGGKQHSDVNGNVYWRIPNDKANPKKDWMP